MVDLDFLLQAAWMYDLYTIFARHTTDRKFHKETLVSWAKEINPTAPEANNHHTENGTKKVK